MKCVLQGRSEDVSFSLLIGLGVFSLFGSVFIDYEIIMLKHAIVTFLVRGLNRRSMM